MCVAPLGDVWFVCGGPNGKAHQRRHLAQMPPFGPTGALLGSGARARIRPGIGRVSWFHILEYHLKM